MDCEEPLGPILPWPPQEASVPPWSSPGEEGGRVRGVGKSANASLGPSGRVGLDNFVERLIHGLAVSKVLHSFTPPESSPARNHRTRWAEEP